MYGTSTIRNILSGTIISCLICEQTRLALIRGGREGGKVGVTEIPSYSPPEYFLHHPPTLCLSNVDINLFISILFGRRPHFSKTSLSILEVVVREHKVAQHGLSTKKSKLFSFSPR